MTFTGQHLDLTGDVKELLIVEIPNEILNGFKVPEFERVIGIPEPGFRAMVLAFRSAPNVSVNREQAVVLGNALNAAMHELTSEFQTRTGYETSKAVEVLSQLQAFITSQGVV